MKAIDYIGMCMGLSATAATTTTTLRTTTIRN